MEFTRKIKCLTMALAAITLISSGAKAQTEVVAITGTVLNTMTIVETAAMNFGTLVAIADDGDEDSLNIAVDGTTTITDDPLSVIFIQDATGISQATITVADATGTINIEIDAATAPTNGGAALDTFSLTNWVSQYAAGGSTSRTLGTPWTETFVGATDTLNIGVSIGTPVTGAGPAAMADGAYVGDFTLIFSY